ncbi:MAG TPA: metal ABC transporter substrate-binding protein [Polyangiales bacterium]|nr:metal ABC transporter substrate-binding protein [Polyangiales bacterium]
MPRISLSAFLIGCFALVTVSSARADGPIDVVATLSDLGDIAAAVGGDKVHVTTLASGLQDPHFVDPKPSYVVKLRDAELFLVNGLDLEIGWVPPLLDSARNGRIKVGAAGYVDCSKGIPVLEVPSGQLTRAEGDVHPYGNPHYLTDPLNGKIVAQTLADAFSRVRPNDAAYFESRKKAFQAAIDEAMFGKPLVDLVGGKKLDRLARSGELEAFLASQSEGGASLTQKLGGWYAKLKPLRGKPVVFYHRSYSYFAERFGLRTPDFVELKPGIQPGPAHLAELVTAMRRDGIGIVATHPFYDDKIAKLVADKAGARLITLPLNVGGVKGASTYLRMFDTVTTLFVNAAPAAGK